MPLIIEVLLGVKGELAKETEIKTYQFKPEL